MGLLVIRERGRKDRVFKIRRERVSIGRDFDADLVLSHTAVSRRHASLVTFGGECELVDEGSTNGVKVNGERTEQRLLEHGDVIRIGGYRLEYYDERRIDLMQVMQLAGLGSADRPSLPDNMKTLFILQDTLDDRSPVELACEQATLIRENGRGGRWKPGTRRLSIGPGGDVPVGVDLTSQPVAEIRWDGSRHLFRSWSRACRVEVDGHHVLEVPLEDGSQIVVADAVFTFVHEEMTDEVG